MAFIMGRLILAQPVFNGRLQPLREAGRALWSLAVAEHPILTTEPQIVGLLPTVFLNSALATRISNVTHAIHLATHRSKSKEALDGLVKRYLGVARSGEDASQT